MLCHAVITGGEEDSQEACLISVDRPGEGKREWDRQCQATDGNAPIPFGQPQFNDMEVLQALF